MMIILGCFWLILLILWLGYSYRQKKMISQYIGQGREFEGVKGESSVIDAKRLSSDFKYRFRLWLNSFVLVFQPQMSLKLLLFCVISIAFVYVLSTYFLMKDFLVCLLLIEPILFFLFFLKLKEKKAENFKNNFPDALNILSGAVSSGQSIISAFEYVGAQLKNEVGDEFKYMAERLQIGESPDDVLQNSAVKFPYIEYFFFASTVSINISRGGQLKDIIKRINRLMFESRSIEKKKNALTAEARASAKIIACLPVIFIIILKFTSPENYHFVMFAEEGKGIFYYVVVSELIGFLSIWNILRGVST